MYDHTMKIWSLLLIFCVVCLKWIEACDQKRVHLPLPSSSSSPTYWDDYSEWLRKDQEQHWQAAPADDQAEWNTWLTENPGMEHLVPYEHQNQY